MASPVIRIQTHKKHRDCRMCGKHGLVSQHHLRPKKHHGLTVSLCPDCHESLHIGDVKVEAMAVLWMKLTAAEREHVLSDPQPSTFFHRRLLAAIALAALGEETAER